MMCVLLGVTVVAQKLHPTPVRHTVAVFHPCLNTLQDSLRATQASAALRASGGHEKGKLFQL